MVAFWGLADQRRPCCAWCPVGARRPQPPFSMLALTVNRKVMIKAFSSFFTCSHVIKNEWCVKSPLRESRTSVSVSPTVAALILRAVVRSPLGSPGDYPGVSLIPAHGPLTNSPTFYCTMAACEWTRRRNGVLYGSC